MPTCPSCGSDAVEEERGTATCTVCGTVLEDSIIVSEVTFTEDSSVVEQFVGAEGQVGGLHGYSRNSLVAAINHGRDLIQGMAANLKLNTGHIDAAVKYYKMAAQRKFTAGRSSNHVAASCLYIVCREERSPHMLLDFADLLKVNVYKLASTFLKLRLELSVTLPVIDPVLFLPRFVTQLDLGKQRHEVGRTAIRIVSRMKRDWLHFGRRPAGICGAALLLAARLHGYARTQKDVVHAVKVCSTTVRKRLDEFADTPSAKLTMEEFLSIDLEGEADPPAFKKSQEERQLALQRTVEECEQLAASKEFASLDETMADSGEAASQASQASSSLAAASSAASKALVESGKVQPPPKRAKQTDTGPKPWEKPGDDELSDDSEDEELEDHILNEEEVKVKTAIWTQNNQEYLERQAQKKQEEANVPKKTRKRRQQQRVPEHKHHRGTARERLKAEEKKSSKIDYASLQSLFGGGGGDVNEDSK